MVSKNKARKKRAQVFCVPSDESSSGKHEVIYAADGDLNKAARLGNIKRFTDWDDAVGFAHKAGVQLGAEVTIHEYITNPAYITNYRWPRSKTLGITPKRPKLRR